jgi:anion-transporting  ArsA/GET3 family ATPase
VTAFPGVRLHVVSGKGGTGKTTVAGALALALATGGRKVLLAEVEGRGGLAQLFDTAPQGYAEHHLAAAPGGGQVFGLAVDPEEALLEYLEMFYKLRRAGSALKRLGAIDFATTVAPGMRDVLLTGKVMEATRRSGAGARPVYDAVVLDAPPTGRITKFLNVNSEVAGLAKAGPIHGHAQQVMSVIGSPLTAVHLVTLLEEMPVQETVDGVSDLRAAGLRVGGVFINMVRPAKLPAKALAAARTGTLDRAAIATSLTGVGITPDEALIDGLALEGKERAERVALESSERKELAALGLPTAELPLIPDLMDVGAIYQLAELLRQQVLT